MNRSNRFFPTQDTVEVTKSDESFVKSRVRASFITVLWKTTIMSAKGYSMNLSTTKRMNCNVMRVPWS